MIDYARDCGLYNLWTTLSNDYFKVFISDFLQTGTFQYLFGCLFTYLFLYFYLFI